MNARRVVAALAIFALVASGIGVTIAVLMADKPPAASERTVPTTALQPKVPTPAEFQLGVLVTEQQCVEPDRCAYKYRVEPKYLGLHPIPDKEIKVVYQVTGGHEPQTGDFTLRGLQARVPETVVEGPPGARLQAMVTEIIG